MGRGWVGCCDNLMYFTAFRYIRMARNRHNQCGVATYASYPLVWRINVMTVYYTNESCVILPKPVSDNDWITMNNSHVYWLRAAYLLFRCVCVCRCQNCTTGLEYGAQLKIQMLYFEQKNNKWTVKCAQLKTFSASSIVVWWSLSQSSVVQHKWRGVVFDCWSKVHCELILFTTFFNRGLYSQTIGSHCETASVFCPFSKLKLPFIRSGAQNFQIMALDDDFHDLSHVITDGYYRSRRHSISGRQNVCPESRVRRRRTFSENRRCSIDHSHEVDIFAQQLTRRMSDASGIAGPVRNSLIKSFLILRVFSKKLKNCR